MRVRPKNSVPRRALAWLLYLAGATALLAFVGTRPSPSLGQIVNLVVADVQVRDAKTGKPIVGLTAKDFELEDNGEPVRLNYFSANATDPIALWFVGGCSDDNKARDELNTAKHDALLKQGLSEFGAQDTIGLAQLCGQEAKVNFAPTIDREKVSSTLEDVLLGRAAKQRNDASLESLRKTFQLLTVTAPTDDVAPVPVIVFVRPSELSVTRSDAQAMAVEILSHTRTIVYDLGDKQSSADGRSLKTSVALLPYLSAATGGRSFSKRTVPGVVFGDVAAGLHSRYLLAWMPPSLDSGWHEIKIRLTQDASKRNASAVVTCRAGYSIRRNSGRYTVTENSNVVRGPTDFASAEDQAGTTAQQSGVVLSVEGSTFTDTSGFAQFKVRVDGDTLDWNRNVAGEDHSKLALDILFYSADQKVLSREVHKFSVERNKTDDWMRLATSVELSVISSIPAGASYVRFRVRDESSGRAGKFDLPMKSVLEAPKHRRYGVIY